jgi:hypothetical protein
MKTISIGADFSETPVGRFPSDGPFSGERFREEFLKPALTENDKVTVKIDDAEGYGSSFLHEAFGGLVQKRYFTVADLKKKLVIGCVDTSYQIYNDLIWKYINEARPE